MVEKYAIAGLAVAVMAAGWVAVQLAWRRVFPPGCHGDPDALAGRSGCHGCDEEKDCGRETAPAGKEGS